jgi:putative transposase
VEEIGLLKEAFRYVKQRKPFRMEAVVILPDHLHCIWTLPPEDANFSIRWSLLKGHFSRFLPTYERISLSRIKRRERGIWQCRFWAHLLASQDDFNSHLDYFHWNPVKHGWVRQVADWPHSSFHQFVDQVYCR